MKLSQEAIESIKREWKKVDVEVRGEKGKFYDKIVKKYKTNRDSIRRAIKSNNSKSIEKGKRVTFTFAGSLLKGSIIERDTDWVMIKGDDGYKYPIRESELIFI